MCVRAGMCMGVFVCLCVCTGAFVRGCVRIYDVRMCTYVHAMRVCVNVRAFVCVLVCVCVCVYSLCVFICACVRAFVCVRVSKREGVHTYACIEVYVCG